MNMKPSDVRYIKIPFTLYDLFGYLLPGLLFFALFPITYDFSKIINIVSDYIRTGAYCERTFLLLQIRDTLSISPLLLLFYCILIAYLVGHVIAALSSLILERFFVDKFLKYPAANMFGIRKYQGWVETIFFEVVNFIPGWKLLKKSFSHTIGELILKILKNHLKRLSKKLLILRLMIRATYFGCVFHLWDNIAQ